MQSGQITHAIRMTAQTTDTSYLWPARHEAGARSDPNLPPMGARFRLKASFDISGYSPQAQVVLRAMQHYGLILADNGSNWYFGGTADPAWPQSLVDELKTIPASAFEAVDESSLMVSPDSGQAGVLDAPGPGLPVGGLGRRRVRLRRRLLRLGRRPAARGTGGRHRRHAVGQRVLAGGLGRRRVLLRRRRRSSGRWGASI